LRFTETGPHIVKVKIKNNFQNLLVRKGTEVNEHVKLSNIILRHKLNKREQRIFAVMHFTVTVGYQTMSRAHIQK